MYLITRRRCAACGRTSASATSGSGAATRARRQSPARHSEDLGNATTMADGRPSIRAGDSRNGFVGRPRIAASRFPARQRASRIANCAVGGAIVPPHALRMLAQSPIAHARASAGTDKSALTMILPGRATGPSVRPTGCASCRWCRRPSRLPEHPAISEQYAAFVDRRGPRLDPTSTPRPASAASRRVGQAVRATRVEAGRCPAAASPSLRFAKREGSRRPRWRRPSDRARRPRFPHLEKSPPITREWPSCCRSR